MKHARLIAGALGILVLCSGVVVFITHIRWVGFPDGFVTVFEQYEKTLFQILVWESMLIGTLFLYLGWKIPQKKIITHIWTLITIHSGFTLILLIARHALYLLLNHGQGG